MRNPAADCMPAGGVALMMGYTKMGAAIAAVAFNLALPSPAAATTLVAQWNMDNTFGTMMTDSSGTGNDGTTYNIVTSGAGYVFDGATSKVVVPDSPTLNPGTNDFSFSVQIQTGTVPPTGTDFDLMRKGNNPTKGGEFKIELVNANGKAKALCLVKDSLRHSANIRGGGSLNLADNQLHTITCTKTATSLSVKIDSRVPATKATSIGSVTNSLPLLLGAKTTASSENDPAGDWYSGTMRSASISIEP